MAELGRTTTKVTAITAGRSERRRSGARLDGSGKRAVQFVAGVGVEVLDFAPPVELEGKPERYLQTVRPLARRD